MGVIHSRMGSTESSVVATGGDAFEDALKAKLGLFEDFGQKDKV